MRRPLTRSRRALADRLVPLPEIVMNHLEMPDLVAGLRVERHQGVRVQVVTGPPAAVGGGGGRGQRHVPNPARRLRSADSTRRGRPRTSTNRCPSSRFPARPAAGSRGTSRAACPCGCRSPRLVAGAFFLAAAVARAVRVAPDDDHVADDDCAGRVGELAREGLRIAEVQADAPAIAKIRRRLTGFRVERIEVLAADGDTRTFPCPSPVSRPRVGSPAASSLGASCSQMVFPVAPSNAVTRPCASCV